MRKGLSKILVTGGAGFIGSAFVRLLARDCPRSTAKGLSLKNKKGLSPKGTVPELVIVDKLTYAGDLTRLKEAEGGYKFYKADICNKAKIEPIIARERPGIIVNFAAQTHVDRSIKDAAPFIETNIKGTYILLEATRKYKVKRFIQISSDEVYGEISKGRFTEDSPLNPNSPYAASKAAADQLIKSYIRTYNLPAIIVRPCNNYGPWQYPEKFIPVIIYQALRNKKVPVYAKGLNVREWLYVQDCAEGILRIMQKGRIGEIYNLGSGEEKRNIDMAKTLLRILNKDNDLIEFVKDRPGHDIRYSLNSQKVFDETGWQPRVNFLDGLKITVRWYLKHKHWLFAKHSSS